MSELTDEIDADAVDSGALTGAGFTPPGDCGNPNDHGDPKKGTDDPLYLWDVVKKLPSTNGYAVLGGQHMKLKDDFHKLLVASDRITGMECYNQNQFHIHLSGVKTAVRTQLNDAAKAGKIHDVTAWNDTLVTLGTPKDTYVYRVAHVQSLDVNPLKLLDQYVVGNYKDRFAQSLAIISGSGTGSNLGYYLIATQGKTRPPQVEHKPTLRDGNYYGCDSFQGLMDVRHH